MLIVELGMWEDVDVNREAVVEDGVLASARVVDVGCEAIGGGDIVTGACFVDLDSGANDEGCDLDDNHDGAVDEGCLTVDEGNNAVEKGSEEIDESHDDIDEGCEVVGKNNVLVGTVASPLVALP